MYPQAGLHVYSVNYIDFDEIPVDYDSCSYLLFTVNQSG